MITTTIGGLASLFIKINLVIIMFLLIKLVFAKIISSTVNGLYYIGEKFPIMYKIGGAIFSMGFIALIVIIGIAV